MKQLFYIEGEFLGEAARSVVLIPNGGIGRPLSKLFYCVRCGDAFARCPIVSEEGVLSWQSSWTAVPACCSYCPTLFGTHVPGSLWHSDSRFLSALPDAVLEREFYRHLEWAEGGLI